MARKTKGQGWSHSPSVQQVEALSRPDPASSISAATVATGDIECLVSQSQKEFIGMRTVTLLTWKCRLSTVPGVMMF